MFFDYAFGFVLLWDPKGSVVATDAFIPRRRSALAGHSDGHSVRKDNCLSSVPSRWQRRINKLGYSKSLSGLLYASPICKGTIFVRHDEHRVPLRHQYPCKSTFWYIQTDVWIHANSSLEPRKREFCTVKTGLLQAFDIFFSLWKFFITAVKNFFQAYENFWKLEWSSEEDLALQFGVKQFHFCPGKEPIQLHFCHLACFVFCIIVHAYHCIILSTSHYYRTPNYW